jgi:hypothetical protein
MIQRCTNPRAPNFKHYGGRGIKVCAEWREFKNFLRDMGIRPKSRELERRNNDGDYEPSNCYWATRYEQTRNSRRNRMLTHKGETLCVADWARRIGLNPQTLHSRLSAGMPINRVLYAGSFRG